MIDTLSTVSAGPADLRDTIQNAAPANRRRYASAPRARALAHASRPPSGPAFAPAPARRGARP